MNTSKIIILRGNSGSGKTTVAKKLQLYFGSGTFLISQDTVRRDMLHVHDRPGNMAVDLLTTLVEYGYENCSIVILEGILYSDIYRKVFETATNKYTNNVYAYYFDIPFEETVRRHKTRPNSDEFGMKEMKGWWRDKDYLDLIPEYTIDESLGIDETAELITKHVKQGKQT